MKPTSAILAAAAALILPSTAQDPGGKKPIIKVGPAVNATIAAKDVTPDEASKLIAATPGIIVLDVRTEEEFEHEHIKDAVNLNALEKGFEEKVAALDQTKPILLHCQSGRRSTNALKDLGGKVKFPQVYHLKDGFVGWKKAGLPIEGKPLPGACRLGPAGAPGKIPEPKKPGDAKTEGSK